MASNAKSQKVGEAKKIVHLTQREQILLRPNVVIGNPVPIETNEVVPTFTGPKCVKGFVSKALLKIIEEPIANARDASIGDPSADAIHFTLLSETGEISIRSMTRLDIAWDADANDWNAALAFSVLNTSSNYDDSVQSFGVGQNGLGVKATMIFSKIARVIVCNPSTGKVYVGKFASNMSDIVVSNVMDVASAVKGKFVKASEAKRNFVDVSFIPDFERFDTPLPLHKNIVRMIEAMLFDAAVTTPANTNVFLNGTKIKTTTLSSYAKLFLGEDGSKIATELVRDERGDVLFELAISFVVEKAPDDPVDDSSSSSSSSSSVSSAAGLLSLCGGARQIVFVNGAHTTAGTVQAEVLRIVSAELSKKKVKITSSALKASLMMVASLPRFPNPRFSDQLKEKLVTPMKEALKWSPSPDFLKKVVRFGGDLVKSIKQEQEEKDDSKAKKQVAAGKGLNIPKYEAATGIGKAGVKTSLLITEGDSAKAFAVAGIGGLGPDGRKKYGVYPILGKVLNVKKVASLSAAVKNPVIANILKITGVVPNKTYDATSVRSLPYRHVVLMTDQDTDGSHITGLVMALFHQLARSVLKVWPDFIKRFPTPVVRIMEGKYSGNEFFSELEHENFVKAHSDARNAKVKFFKGLGTSTTSDAKRHLKNADNLLTAIVYNGAPSDEAMLLAFGTKKEGGKDVLVEARRRFLSEEYDKTSFVDYSKASVTFEELIETEVGRFFYADNLRSIPSVLDGLKPSTRKIMHVALSTKGEMNVARYGAHVAKEASYHHGEASLYQSIKGMASTYTGSGNVSFLKPNGQFGTRHLAGKDAAAPRYITTEIDPVSFAFFKKDDLPLLKKELDDDKKPVQPVFFVPVVATALLNGASGVGTGWSSDVPSFNPLDLISAARMLAKGLTVDEKSLPLVPWANGWRGKMLPTDNGYFSIGVFEMESPRRIRVTELPLGVGTEDWISSITTPLKSSAKDGKDSGSVGDGGADGAAAHSYIKEIIRRNTNDTIDMTLVLSRSVDEDKIIKIFKLAKKVSLTNMNLLDRSEDVVRYESVYDILAYHAKERLALYELVKKNLIHEAEKKLDVLRNKIRYVSMVIRGELKLGQLSTSSLNELLAEKEFLKVERSFSYLLGIATGSLTTDNVKKMEKEVQDVEAKIDFLKRTNAMKMWLADLDELEKAVEDYNARREASVSGDEGVSGGKKRKGVV